MQISSYSSLRESARPLRSSYDIKRDWMLPAGVAVLTIAFLVFTFGYQMMPTPDDVDLYYQYANRMLGGQIPYRDFNIEYPPVAMLFFVFPAIFSNSLGLFSPVRYILLFQAEAYLLAVGTLMLSWQTLRKLYPVGKMHWRLGYMSLAIVIISLFVFRRFDIAATFLITLSFYLLLNGKPGWGGASLGLATAAKLYPVVALPLIVLYLWRGKDDRESALRMIYGFTIAGAATVLPFVLTGLPGILNFLRYHSERGVQIESLFASAIWLGSVFGFTTAKASDDHGSTNLVSSWGSTLASASTLLTVAGLLVIYGYIWWLTRNNLRRNRVDLLFQATALAVLWFIIANKVLSPQYLIWLAPFIFLWRGPKMWIYLLAICCSTIAFPFMVVGVSHLDWQPMLVLLFRNILLVALFALLVRDILRISRRV